MRLLSVLLLACMFFLSSFAGMVKTTTEPSGKGSCCQRTTGKPACHGDKGKTENKSCDEHGCNVMLSCSMCGFIIVEPVRVQPDMANYLPKPIPLYKIGDLSAFHSSDWKPPRAVV